MTQGTVVLLGKLPVNTAPLTGLVQEFGWTLEIAPGLNEIRDLGGVRRPVAILFDAQSLGLSWREALRTIREIDSQALLIVCHRFSDVVNWSELADAGAFHALALPFDLGEVRQSLAFIWAARFRDAAESIEVSRMKASPSPLLRNH
jgi:DNA-binding NtrC family response regulator